VAGDAVRVAERGAAAEGVVAQALDVAVGVDELDEEVASVLAVAGLEVIGRERHRGPVAAGIVGVG
jgi:hypothetical protein